MPLMIRAATDQVALEVVHELGRRADGLTTADSSRVGFQHGLGSLLLPPLGCVQRKAQGRRRDTVTEVEGKRVGVPSWRTSPLRAGGSSRVSVEHKHAHGHTICTSGCEIHSHTHRHTQAQKLTGEDRGTRKHRGVHTSKDALRHVSVCT